MHRDYQTLVNEMSAIEVKILTGKATKEELAAYGVLKAEQEAHPQYLFELATIETWVKGMIAGKYRNENFHEDLEKIRREWPSE